MRPDIDLTSMIPTLDNTASEIVQYQRDSTVQRKDLAQKTKEFRKLDDAAKLVEVKTLLKGRQCAWSVAAWTDHIQRIKHSLTCSRITRSLPIQHSYKSTLHYPKPPIHILCSKRPLIPSSYPKILSLK